MLEMVKSDKMQTTTEIESQYPGCKYILTDVGGDHVTVMGKLYCLSDSSDSWGELIEMSKEVELGGKECSIFGSYRNGFAYGLQYVVEQK